MTKPIDPILKIYKETNLPHGRRIQLSESVGKTIKFAESRKISHGVQVNVIVFTDDTWVVMNYDTTFGYQETMTLELPTNLDFQSLLIKARLTSKKKCDKFNAFWKKRWSEQDREREIEQAKKLLVKYPELLK